MPRPIRTAAAQQLATEQLREMSPARILELADSDNVAAAIVFSRRGGCTSQQILDRVDAPDLVLAAVWLLKSRDFDDLERSDALYRMIVLDQAGDRSRTQAALLTVWHVAARLRLRDQRAILERAVVLGSQPVDPYDPHPITLAARSAAGALLRASSRHDEILHEHLRSAGPAGLEVARTYAIAVQGRTNERDEAIVALVRFAASDRREAVRLVRLADSRYSESDRVGPAPDRISSVSSGFGTGWSTVAGVLPLAFAASLGLVVGATSWLMASQLGTPPKVNVSASAAFAALGALVAVHVVAAELAADRLRGIIARATSSPLELIAGESVALALLFSSAAQIPGGDDERSWVHAALAGSLTIALLAASTRLLHRTDPVSAARAYVRARRRQARKAGRQVGAAQAAASETRAVIKELGWARHELTAPTVRRRHPIRADQRGVFQLDIRQLRRIDRRAHWKSEELRLAVNSPVGTTVEKDDEVLSIVPSEMGTIQRRDERIVMKAVRVASIPLADRLVEGVASLIAMASDLASAGNPDGAAAISEQLIVLVNEHQRHLHRTAKLAAGETGASPLLVAAADRTMTLYARADFNADGALLRLAQRLLSTSEASDAFGAALLARASVAFGHQPDRKLLGLAWDVGDHALHIGDELSLFSAREVLERLLASSDTRDRAYESSARLLQVAAFTDQERASQLWEWFDGLNTSQISPAWSTYLCLRVGASALLAGHMSLALQAAFRLDNVDWDKLLSEHLEDRAMMERESLQSQLYNHVLGGDPQRALQRFARFARDAGQAAPRPLQTPSASTSPIEGPSA